MSPANSLEIAKVALEKGEYKKCLLSLSSLLENMPLLSKDGGQIGILMITALIGQGDNEKAISICKVLLKHNNDLIRQQAKQLIVILNSPELARPKEWSVKIPLFKFDTPLNQIKTTSYRKQEESIPKPKTGTTKNPKTGFTILSILLFTFLIILSSYLS